MAKQFSMFSIFHDCPSTNEQEQSENNCSNIPFSEEEDSAIKSKNDIHYSFNKANTPKSDPLDFFFPCSTNDTSEFCSDTLSNQYQNKNNDFCEESKYDEKNVFKRSLESHSHSYEVEEKDFSIIASSFHNFDLVKCREQIDYITNCCISDILKEINKIKTITQNSEVHTERFGERIANLYLQQDEFEKLISSVKTQFTISKGQTTHFSVDIITKSLQKEFALFKNFFPAYGFRQKVLNEVERNQITIINADFTYGFNVVLPVILSNVYKNHTLIACETNETLSYVLQEKLNLIFSCSDQNPHETQLHVLSENQLLERFSYTTLFSESNSCIIFNVSLKRSVIADIVLSNLRDLLITQKKFKASINTFSS